MDEMAKNVTIELFWLPNKNELIEIKEFLVNPTQSSQKNLLALACVRTLKNRLSKSLDIQIELKDVRQQTSADIETSHDTEHKQLKMKASPLSYNEGIYKVHCILHLEKPVSDCYIKIINMYCLYGHECYSWLHLDITNVLHFRMTRWSQNLKLSYFGLGNFVGIKYFVEHFNSKNCFPKNSHFKITQVRGKFWHDTKIFEVFFVVALSNVPSKKRNSKTHQWHKLVIPYSSLRRLIICHDNNFAAYFHFLEYPLLYVLNPLKWTGSDDADCEFHDEDYRSITFEDVIENDTEWLRVVNLFDGCPADIRREFSMNTVLKLEFLKPDYDTINCFLNFSKHTVTYFGPIICQTAKDNVQIKGISLTKDPNSCEEKNETQYDCFYALKCLVTRSNELIDQFMVIPESESGINKYLNEKFKENPAILANALVHIYFSFEQGNIIIFPIAIRALYEKLLKEKSITDTIKRHRGKELDVFITNDNIVNVKKAILMPTHVRFVPYQPSLNNRMLRNGDATHFIRVSIRDTNLAQVSFTTKKGHNVIQNNHQIKFFDDYIKSQLLKGIDIGGRRYEYLGASTSQLRSHNLWCYAKDSKGRTADTIRKTIGFLDQIQDVPKFMARMGQTFSQAMGRITVPQSITNLNNPEEDIECGEKIYMESDNKCIKRNDKKFLQEKKENCVILEEKIKEKDLYNFSDGIGRMSTEIAEQIYESLQLTEDRPSAAQIRYAGCKGMLLLDPTLEGKQIMFRKSMKKFDGSRDESLEILKTSKPRSVHMNRQLITILEFKGVSKEKFFQLQKEMINSLIKSMFYDEDAEFLLNVHSQLRLNYKELLKCGVSFTEDPFFRSMIISIFKQQIYLLKSKCRIKLPEDKARNMFGVLDETGTLEYGEVFVQYTKWDSKETEVLEGTVVITKNPCMQPGDVRKFTAIDVPGLHHVRDCVVFPSKGPRPHPDEMAGSDLDGDEYDVIWLEDLIFVGDNSPAMHFATPKKQQIKREYPVQRSEEIDHIRNYSLKNIVGIIANAHLAHADRTSLDDEKCKILARKYARALDFAKSGEIVQMSKDDFVSIYPDFMEKSDKACYLSTKVLGYLYRNCKSLDTGLEATVDKMEYKMDTDLIHDQWKVYKDSADKMYLRYSKKMCSWLKEYGLENEGSLLSGSFIVASKLYSEREEKHSLLELLEFEVMWLFRQLEKEFFYEFGGKCYPEQFTEAMFKKASAWYVISYSSKADTSSCYGMPWAVADVLIEFKKKKKRKFYFSNNIFEKKSSYIEEAINQYIKGQLPVPDESKIGSYKYEVLDAAKKILDDWLSTWFHCMDKTNKILDDEFSSISSRLLSCDDNYILSLLTDKESKKIISPGYYVIETLIQIAHMGSYQDPYANYTDSFKEFGMFAWVTLIKLACSCNPQHLGISCSSGTFTPTALYAVKEDVHELFIHHIGNSDISKKFCEKINFFEDVVINYLQKYSQVHDICIWLKEKPNESKKAETKYVLKIMAYGSRYSIECLRKLITSNNFELLIVKDELPNSKLTVQQSMKTDC